MPIGDLLGGLFGGGDEFEEIDTSGMRDATFEAIDQSFPFDVFGPGGSTVFDRDAGSIISALSPQLAQALEQLGAVRGNAAGSLGDPSFEANELERLRTMAAPREDALRDALASRLFGSGRLGLTTGGGVSGSPFQPELAGLEEGLARVDLERVDQARRVRMDRLREMLSVLGAESSLTQLPGAQAGLSRLGVPDPSLFQGLFGAANADVQGQFAQAETEQAATEGFFGSLFDIAKPLALNAIAPGAAVGPHTAAIDALFL